VVSTNATVAEPVSWELARRVAVQALRLAPILEDGPRRAFAADIDEAALRAQSLVEATTGLVSVAGPPNAVVVDRLGWVDANIASFRRLLNPLAEKLAERPRLMPAISSPAGAAVSGAEVGLVLAWLSSRVLGQYDLFAGGDDGGDAVYFVAPNIIGIERRHAFPPQEFRLWIAIHELTHRAQFTGVPWMREYFLGLVERGTMLSPPDGKTIMAGLLQGVEEIRSGRNPLADGGIVSLLASTEQLATLHEAQALMSLLEGHSDVVMSSAATAEIPGAKRFARVLSERRTSTKGLAKLLQQFIGIDAKLRQYEEGERFVEAVQAEGGDELLAKVWSRQEFLPTLEEIREPSDWIARTAGATSQLG
jgi:coenzyme F420 biosynthesis associated uncharacterized protein